MLEGHEDNAEFALGVSTTQQPRVASGGKDNLVCCATLRCAYAVMCCAYALLVLR